MEERESYQPSLIRLWRVFRTCKEMCLDRVRLFVFLERRSK